jgi:hypothetical protein
MRAFTLLLLSLSLMMAAASALSWPPAGFLNVNSERVIEEAANANPAVVLNGEKDICVLGGGASGMAAAVFAKDANMSVIVIDTASTVGGQCNTLDFVPPAPGYPSWIDVGVQFFADTRAANASGLGPWSIDSVALVRRFAGNESVAFLDFTQDTTPNYAVNLAAGISYGFQPPQNQTSEFYQAYVTLQTIIASYPWIDRAEVPSPVPEELLVPFSTFISVNGLAPLVPGVFIPQLFAGGLGDFDRLTTLYALLNLAPTVSHIFSVPDAGFVINGGCQRIYDGMSAYLGNDSILVNAHTLYAIRSHAASVPAVIGGVVGAWGGRPNLFRYTCPKILVTYPQTLSAMLPLNLDARETRLFSRVATRTYITGDINADVEFASQTGGSFNMLNLDLQNPGLTPALPAITQLTRGLPYGPVQFKASSNMRLLQPAAVRLIEEQLAGMPAELLNNTEILNVIIHNFQPHFTDDELKRPNGGYAALQNLQGHRKTYYLGSLRNFPVTYTLWNAAYEMIQAIVADNVLFAGEALSSAAAGVTNSLGGVL